MSYSSEEFERLCERACYDWRLYLPGPPYSLNDRHSPPVLSAPVKNRILALKELQSKHHDLEGKFFEERSALKAKYQMLYEPLYSMRYEIVNGLVDFEENENESPNDTLNDESKEEEKGVLEFWLTAMKRNDDLAFEITGRDKGALKYLRDIKWYRIDNPEGFKLEFYFGTNPYFKDSVLTKTYHMIDDDKHGKPIWKRAIGMEIDWYPGKCLTKKPTKKKPKKRTKILEPVTKTEKCRSFFNFFDPPRVPDDDLKMVEEIEHLHKVLQEDFDIGSTIRDKIIPHAVSWFTGEACQLDEFEDEEENEYEDEEDEEEDKQRKPCTSVPKKVGIVQKSGGTSGEQPT